MPAKNDFQNREFMVRKTSHCQSSLEKRCGTKPCLSYSRQDNFSLELGFRP